jgi:hypothetical protein
MARPLLCKALLKLSGVSALHPRCFPLSGLRPVGQQVAAGAFGDIWKGLVRGQLVSVKIMRLFQDADIKAVLKVGLITFVSLISVSLMTSRHLGVKLSCGASFPIRTCFPFTACIICLKGCASFRHGWKTGIFSSSYEVRLPIRIASPLWVD